MSSSSPSPSSSRSRDIDTEQLNRLLGGIVIPPRPTLLIELDKELKRDEPDMKIVANLVGRDVGISAAIMKTLNSPLFALRSKVSSIPHAVQILGLRNVRSIVTGLVLRRSVGPGASFERFWDSAEKVATINAYLCSMLPRAPREEAYMFGLFRDCGIPILMQRFPDYRETLRLASLDIESPTRPEEERHGTSHPIVGYMIGRSWGLPDPICDAIRHHHDLTLLDSDEFQYPLTRTLVSINFVAEHINDTSLHMRQDDLWQDYGLPILDYLGMTEKELHEIEEDICAMCS